MIPEKKQTNKKRYKEALLANKRNAGVKWRLGRRWAVKEEGNIMRFEQHAVGGTDNSAI